MVADGGAGADHAVGHDRGADADPAVRRDRRRGMDHRLEAVDRNAAARDHLRLFQVGRRAGHAVDEPASVKVARLVATAEIGRASCRDRVCQYVSTSVVTVSFKKKSSSTQYHTTLHKG